MNTPKRTRGLLKIVGKAVALGTALLMAVPLDALACTQIWVGPKLTDTGDVYVGRSEDYAPRHPKAFGVQEPRENPTFSSDESNFKWTYTGKTYRYTYVRDLPSGWDNRTDAYPEAGTNEHGVSCSATLTTDQNEKIDAADPTGNANSNDPSGIGEYTIPDIVLGCSKTAREGVKLLGSIIEKHGAYDNNQVIIADAKETWLFSMVSGHQWTAVNLTKVAADKVSVNPNIGRLKFKVNIDDENECLHSANLVKTAEDAGSKVTFDDGTFDIASSYGLENPGASQWTRYAQGRAYFGKPLQAGEFTYTNGKGVTAVTDPQLFFTPGKTGITLFEAQRATCTRGEGLPGIDANQNPVYAIGNNRTVEAHMFQIRKGLSSDIATIQWQNLSRGEFGVFVPSYSALLTKVDTKLFPTNGQWGEKPVGNSERNDSVDAAMDASLDDGSLDYTIMNINTLAYNKRKAIAKPVRQYLDALQKQVIEQHKAIDAKMKTTDAAKRSELANAAHAAISQQVYEKAYKLLGEMRTWLLALREGKVAPGSFVASDFNATKNDLKEPLRYSAGVAEQLNAPDIHSFDSVSEVKAGEKIQATALAQVIDSDAKSAKKITYTWYAAEGDVKVAEGSNAKFDAPAKPGTYKYYVVATNTVNGKTTRKDFNVTVKAADAKPGKTDVKPGKTTKPDSGKSSKKTMPKTGDSFNVAAVCAAGMLGVAATLYAYERKQRAGR